MSYFVYILESDQSRHYIGFSSNLQQRIIKHNAKHKGFTGTSEIWGIIIYKEVETKSEAMQLEKKLKSFKNYRRAIEYMKKIGGISPSHPSGTRSWFDIVESDWLEHPDKLYS